MKPYQDAEIYQEMNPLTFESRYKSYRSVRSSEDESEGYETMTATSSTAVSMVTTADSNDRSFGRIMIYTNTNS